MTAPKECHGKMFPPVGSLERNRHVQGRVFGYVVEMPGIVATAHRTTTDTEAWRACTTCPEFEDCYRLSLGRLLMEFAVSR